MPIETTQAVSSRVQSNLPALEKPKWRGLLLLTVIGAIIGTTVPVGYNIGVINSSADYMIKWFNESRTTIDETTHIVDAAELKTLWSGLLLIFSTGGCLGSIAGVWCRDRLGPKNSLTICYTIFIAAALMLSRCGNFEMFSLLLAGRFAVGVASGLAMSILPVYLAEIAPQEFHGTMAALTAIGVSGGIVIAQAVSLPRFLGAEATWGLALSVYVFANIVGLVLLALSPESPKYLFIIAGCRDYAKDVLHRLRGNDNERINREMDTFQKEVVKRTKRRSVRPMLTDPKSVGPNMCLVMFFAIQFLMWSVSAVVYYSSMVFKQAGENATEVRELTLFLGSMVFMMTVLVALFARCFDDMANICFPCFSISIALCQPMLYIRFLENIIARDISPPASMGAVFFINTFPMALIAYRYQCVCRVFEANPTPAPITPLFFYFFSGMSFVSMHSFIGGDSVWLWPIYFFGYFALYCFFEYFRLRRILPMKKKQNQSRQTEVDLQVILEELWLESILD